MHRAVLRELERIGEQVLEDLAEALRVGDDVCRGLGCDDDREVEPFRAGDVIEFAPQIGMKLLDRDLGHLDRRRSRLDLGQVEDAVEETQQVPAGSEDDARVFDLGFGHGVVRVVGELLGEYQEAVERRTQLVRHVRDELGLVFRRDGKLSRFLLDQALGLFHLVVLLLGLDVPLGEEARLPLQVFVRFA